jgi:hypothetical protein
MESCRPRHGLGATTVTHRSGARMSPWFAPCDVRTRPRWEAGGVSRPSRFATEETKPHRAGIGRSRQWQVVSRVWRAAKQARSNADAVGCTLMHADGTGAIASARLPRFGCAMSAVKCRDGPRPICVHQRVSFCICVGSFFLCRVPRCRRPGRTWPGVGAWRCAFWCMGCFLRGSDWRAAPGDGRIGAWGPGAAVFRALTAGRRTGLPPRCMEEGYRGYCRGSGRQRLRQVRSAGSGFRCMGFAVASAGSVPLSRWAADSRCGRRASRRAGEVRVGVASGFVWGRGWYVAAEGFVVGQWMGLRGRPSWAEAGLLTVMLVLAITFLIYSDALAATGRCDQGMQRAPDEAPVGKPGNEAAPPEQSMWK